MSWRPILEYHLGQSMPFILVRALMAKFCCYCDFADQSTKLGIVGLNDVPSNFRRGGTRKSPGTP